jgi:hypothetical protein
MAPEISEEQPVVSLLTWPLTGVTVLTIWSLGSACESRLAAAVFNVSVLANGFVSLGGTVSHKGTL